MITTLRSLLTLGDAKTAYLCYLRCSEMQRMVENYQRGVRDGQPVEYGTWRHTDPSRVYTLAQPLLSARMSERGLTSRGHFHYVIGVRERCQCRSR